MVRRRTRRMIEEAIANGTWIPPVTKPPVHLGQKPALFDTFTIVNPDDADSSLKEKAGLWNAIKVLFCVMLPYVPCLYSRKPVSVVAMRLDNTPQIDQLSIQEPEPTSPPSHLRRLTLWRKPAAPPQSTASETQIPSPSHPPEYKTVTVSVMIAMPSPPEYKQHTHEYGSEDQECPAVEFGIADVELPSGWALDPQRVDRSS